MITEAIVLAGGLGTRLKSVIADQPKSLAPVSGKPFLAYLLDYAQSQGIRKFIFALGYKTEQIESFVRNYLPAKNYSFSVEDRPLGTGGAVYKACSLADSGNLIVLNADTFFGVSYRDLAEQHEDGKASCTLALKPMKNFDRYGVVEIDQENRITGFREKKFRESGLINGGVYALTVSTLLKKKFPETFSLEKDFFEVDLPEEKKLGLVSDAYFIDIGIPEDYQRAQTELTRYL